MKNLGINLNNTRHVVFDKFLSREDIDSLLKLVNSSSDSKMVDSTIYTTAAENKVEKQIRKSKSRVISRGDSPIVDNATDKLLDLLYFEHEKSKVNVAIDLVKYNDSGFLKEHQDPFMDGRKPNREFTAIIYIKEPASGGKTVYPNIGLSITPKPGRMFLFKNIYNGIIDETSVHYGEKTVGEKSILVFFINEINEH